MATRTEKKFDKLSPEKKLKFLMNETNPQRIRFLQRIQNEKEREDLASKIPGFEVWWNINRDMPGGGRKGGITHGATEGTYRVPEGTAPQQKAREVLLAEGMTGLSGLLQQLRTPYQHPMLGRMEQMFGHLENPILQGLINAEAMNMPRGSLFPSDIEREYQQGPPLSYYQSRQQSGLGNLLSVLGNEALRQSVVPWMNQQTPESLEKLYNQGIEQYGQPAYEYVSQSRPLQALSNLYESTPAHMVRGGLYGLATAPLSAYETAQAFGQLGKQGLSSIWDKLKNLRNT